MNTEAKVIKISFLNKIKLILRPETSFYIVTAIYSLGVGLLTLAIPVSVQALVNSVTFGILFQPLIIITIVLLTLLLLSGVLNALQTFTIELFQRHFFARVATDIVFKLLNSNYKELQKENSIGITNRYFDVMTVQKSVATLLAGGVPIVLQTISGLVLLAFYHPYFLVFDFILLFLVYIVWKFYSKEALLTAVNESKSKYKVATWIEELGRINYFFKGNKRKEAAILKADALIYDYLDSRKLHFKRVFKQIIFLLLIYAFMSALILSLGGFLVIDGQLSLGQLVAAELVITVILASFSKSGKYLEAFYDLYAAVDKLSSFYDLSPEINEESLVQTVIKTFDLKFNQVLINTDLHDYNFHMNFTFGKSYLIHSNFYTSKSLFLDLLKKGERANKGKISIGEIDINNISVSDLSEIIQIIDYPQNFSGTIKDNLFIKENNFSEANLIEILEITDLKHILDVFPKKLDTKILNNGTPLWPSQLLRFETARAIIAKPKILILTESFDQVGDDRRKKIINYLLSLGITIIYFTKKELIEEKFDHYLIFNRDEIIQCDKDSFINRRVYGNQ